MDFLKQVFSWKKLRASTRWYRTFWSFNFWVYGYGRTRSM